VHVEDPLLEPGGWSGGGNGQSRCGDQRKRDKQFRPHTQPSEQRHTSNPLRCAPVKIRD
jgi:hypothetical protein